MGSCIQVIFRTKRSQLKQQTLLNHQQLCTMIKSTTINDHQFCSSTNLSIIQKFLSEYSLKPNMQLDIIFINKNIQILNKFILQLRDHTTNVGKQIIIDQQRIKQYINQQLNKNKIDKDIGNIIKNNTILLRLQIQTLLLNSNIIQEIQDMDRDWSLLLEIQEVFINMKKKNSNNSNSNNQNNKQKQNRQSNTNASSQIKIIDRIWIDDFPNRKQSNQNNADSPKKLKKGNRNTQQNSHKSSKSNQIYNQAQTQLQELRLFSFSSKVVHKDSMIKIGLFRVFKKKYLNFIEQQSQSTKSITADKYHYQRQQLKNKIILGQTCLSVSDFIYYNTLVISDVVGLSSPNSIKSSITTVTSSTSSNAGAFISIRGQGLRAETFENDYIKIIKQHQILIQQLQMCLQGNKGWQKLSEFRNSNGSKKAESIYSQYSIPQEAGRMYKI